MDKDGNELDGECSRPQKHAKSPELAREFLLDAATVIFKEQARLAFTLYLSIIVYLPSSFPGIFIHNLVNERSINWILSYNLREFYNGKVMTISFGF